MGETLMTENVCPLCGHREGSLLYQIRNYAIVRCRSCDLIHVSPVPSTEETSAFYQGLASKPRPGSLRGFKYRFLVWLMGRMTGLRGELLEIGCAQGDLGMVLKRSKRWRYHGIDLEPSLLSVAKKKGLEVSYGGIEDQKFDDETFSAVVMWHVLEHLPRPMETLLEVFRVTRKKGVLLVGTPNIEHRRARAQGPRWKYIGPPGHLSYFTPATLRKMVESAGFKVSFVYGHILKTHMTLVAKMT